MLIGLAFDLKNSISHDDKYPDDFLEEYDSPETIEGITSALKNMGHEVIQLGGGRDFLRNIQIRRPDLVFNISEGLGTYRSREAQVPSVLEMLDIPYVGSDPLCLALSLDKSLSKKVALYEGIPTACWCVFKSEQELDLDKLCTLRYPLFVKPLHEGSSKGVRLNSRIENEDEAERLIRQLLRDYRQPVIVEEFLDGDEITVGIIGNDPPVVFGMMRILPRKRTDAFVYSLEVKRNWKDMVEYECPVDLSEEIVRLIDNYALKIYEAIGCRDFARVDFKCDRYQRPYFLEINPLAGLNPLSSDLPIMAGKLGITYETLIYRILDSALKRYSRCIAK